MEPADKKGAAAESARMDLVRAFLKDRYGVTLAPNKAGPIEDNIDQYVKGDKIQAIPLLEFIFNASIEEIGFKSSAYDDGVVDGQFESDNSAPLLLEVKQFRNLSKPHQRVTKTGESMDKIKMSTGTEGVKKDHTFQLICHDGVRFIKIILMMANQLQLISQIHERNKFLLKSGYVDSTTEKGMVNIVVDEMH